MSDPAAEFFQAVIDDHRRRPRNRGPLPAANRVARGENPACGDLCTVQLRLVPDPAAPDARIAELRFTGAGCALSQASASLLTVALVERGAAEALVLADAVETLVRTGSSAKLPPGAPGDLAALAAAHAFPSRHACALLAWKTLREALASPSASAAHQPT